MVLPQKRAEQELRRQAALTSAKNGNDFTIPAPYSKDQEAIDRASFITRKFISLNDYGNDAHKRKKYVEKFFKKLLQLS